MLNLFWYVMSGLQIFIVSSNDLISISRGNKFVRRFDLTVKLYLWKRIMAKKNPSRLTIYILKSNETINLSKLQRNEWERIMISYKPFSQTITSIHSLFIGQRKHKRKIILCGEKGTSYLK